MNHLLAPSLLSADFGNLERDIQLINQSEADWLHLDIMDGVFVPNLSFGFPVLKFVSKLSKKPMDAHLMMIQPDRYLERFAELGIRSLTVHYEACTHLHRTLQKIRALGMKAGVSLNPHSPVSLLEDILPETDLVLLMSVNPGYGGQKFIPQTFKKIRKLRKMITDCVSDALIEVDGGVDLNNKDLLVREGVNVLVAGNTVFKSGDPVAVIHELKQPPAKK